MPKFTTAHPLNFLVLDSGCRGRFSRLRLAAEESVNDDSQSAVAGYVASSAEAVHGNVNGYHQGAVGVVEPEHGGEQSQRSHDGAAGNSGGGDNGYAEHENKAGKHLKVIRYAGGQHKCHGASHNLHHRARHVYGGAERHGEAGCLGRHSSLWSGAA